MDKDDRVFIRVSTKDKKRIRDAAGIVAKGNMSKLMHDAVMNRVVRIEKAKAKKEGKQ